MHWSSISSWKSHFMKISYHAYDAYKCKNSWEKKDKEEFMPIRTVKQHLHLNVTPMTFLRTLATWNSQESHVQMRPIVCLELSFLVIMFIQSNSITLDLDQFIIVSILLSITFARLRFVKRTRPTSQSRDWISWMNPTSLDKQINWNPGDDQSNRSIRIVIAPDRSIMLGIQALGFVLWSNDLVV